MLAPTYFALDAPCRTTNDLSQLAAAPPTLREVRVGGPEIRGEIPGKALATNLRGERAAYSSVEDIYEPTVYFMFILN